MGYSMVPLKRVTDEVLVDLGACSERHNYTDVFPDGAIPTLAIARKYARQFNFHWAGEYLLDDVGKRKFHQLDAKDLDEFRRVVTEAENKYYYSNREKYDSVNDAARKKIALARAENFVRLFKEHPVLVPDKSRIDPDATLAKIRELTVRIERRDYYSHYDMLRELKTEVAALDEWLTKGRRRPKAWVKERAARAVTDQASPKDAVKPTSKPAQESLAA